MNTIIKYRSIIVFSGIAALLFFVGQTAILLMNIVDMFSSQSDITESQPRIQASANKVVELGRYETLQQTMARLRRDVIVTGTITGIPGEEFAMFRIEGMPDRLFKLHSQLMDGFIIQQITTTEVVLKNQRGDETLVLTVYHS